MDMEKKVKEVMMETLPMDIYVVVLQNAQRKVLESRSKGFENDLRKVFVWSLSPQGHDFWEEIWKTYSIIN